MNGMIIRYCIGNTPLVRAWVAIGWRLGWRLSANRGLRDQLLPTMFFYAHCVTASSPKRPMYRVYPRQVRKAVREIS